MNQVLEMFNKVTSSPYHDKMIRSVDPLKTHLGINHFWYNRISYSGHYAYFGSNTEWSGYSSERSNEFLNDIPYLTNPDSAKEGIQLLGLTEDEKLQGVLEDGRKKYNIHFNLQILKKTADGLEGYGFSTCSNHVDMYNLLLREMPLLLYFTKKFRQDNEALFSVVEDNQANLRDIVGDRFNNGGKDMELFRIAQELLE